MSPGLCFWLFWRNQLHMPKKRPRIGIALDSGGAKGGAHIGVLDVLRENAIPVDIIAGSSAGAFVGALHAADAMDRIKAVLQGLTWRESLGYYVDPVLPLSGLLAGKRARAFIKDMVGDVRIEDLPMTFIAVATDLLSGETVSIDTGPLVDAIMASISMPGIFKPVVHMDRLLTDGGVTDPLPLDILKRYAPDITIAVNLHPRLPDRYNPRQRQAIIREGQKQLTRDEDLPTWVMDHIIKGVRSPRGREGILPLAKGLIKRLKTEGLRDIDLVNTLQEQLILSKDKLAALLETAFMSKDAPPFMNIFEILNMATNIQQYQKNKLMLAHARPDILIVPEVNAIGSLDFLRLPEAIAEGRAKTEEALPRIRELTSPA